MLTLETISALTPSGARARKRSQIGPTPCTSENLHPFLRKAGLNQNSFPSWRRRFSVSVIHALAIASDIAQLSFEFFTAPGRRLPCYAKWPTNQARPLQRGGLTGHSLFSKLFSGTKWKEFVKSGSQPVQPVIFPAHAIRAMKRPATIGSYWGNVYRSRAQFEAHGPCFRRATGQTP